MIIYKVTETPESFVWTYRSRFIVYFVFFLLAVLLVSGWLIKLFGFYNPLIFWVLGIIMLFFVIVFLTDQLPFLLSKVRALREGKKITISGTTNSNWKVEIFK